MKIAFYWRRPRNTARDEGSIAIEFAIILPLAIFILIAAAEAMSAITAKRRVDRLCAGVADMTVEHARIGAREEALLRDAVTGLAFGLDTDSLDVELSSFGEENWTMQLLAATDKAPHKASTADQAQRAEEESLIQAACSYSYEPGWLTAVSRNFQFASLAYTAPKRSDSIERE